ncbi:MAG: hypothetical protein ACJAVX_002700 [Pseudoalteromonas rhizosphaerae]|jgi:hypothetical protein|uniref:DUF3015 domain-containing protein n=1 Tax=Pseudoalteromonas neustonica TaxID=1840331 RepID=A0ABY3FA70_9GAMM|nr:DUF3015 family protein [Pseudoalteromonas neustonica]TVU80501.1 DUF3015 domain-containing protein [Pseudoalteromonas neustonica]
MLKATVTAVVLAGAFIAAPLQAKEGLNPWQDCGIGAMVFPENGTAAAISNIIWDLGTTAVSSNISSVGSCEGAGAKTALFIQQTFPVLEQEIAEGEGEYVTAMLNVRGCDASSHGQIVNAIRSDFATKPAQNPQALYAIVESKVTTQFAATCPVI